MTFTQLEIFAKLADLKSFTATAEHFDISQSAVSHALKSLEKQWQISLFHRDQGEIELTETGASLLDYVRDILNLSQALNQEIIELHGLHYGTLRIGSFGASSSTVLIPMILESFGRQYPHIEVYIEEGSDEEIAQWLLERKIDVGFVVLPEEKFNIFPLIEDIFIALIPSQYPIARQQTVSLKDLTEYPFLMTAAGSQNHVKKMFREHGLKPHIKCNFSQLLTIINMVNNQSGVSIIADMALNKELLSLYPNVVKRPLSPNIKRSIALAVKNKQHITPATKAFIEIAQQVLDQKPAKF